MPYHTLLYAVCDPLTILFQHSAELDPNTPDFHRGFKGQWRIGLIRPSRQQRNSTRIG